MKLCAITLIAAFVLFTKNIYATFGPGVFWKTNSSPSSNKLEFVTQPWRTAAVNTSFPVQPKVAILDGSNVIVTSATNTVTLAAYTDSTCSTSAGGTLSASSLSVAAVSGVATFSGVQYNTVGTIYLKATSGSMTSACTNAAFILNPPTIDTSVTGNATSANSVVSSAITTAGANELLLATVVTSNSSCTVTSVSGGSLTWTHLSGQSASGRWMSLYHAFASSAVSNKTVTANLSCSADAAIVVSAYKNVSTTTDVTYTAAGNSLSSDGSNLSLFTMRDYSLYTRHIIDTTANTAGGTETMNASASTALVWTGQQRQTSAAPEAGSTVTSALSGGGSPSTSVFEVLAPRTAVAVPTYSQSYSVENASGAATMDVYCKASGPNELLLVAITWRSASAMSTAPAGLGSTIPATWTSVGGATYGTTQLQVYRAISTAAFSSTNRVRLTIPGSVKASAICATFRGVNTSGTNGSGAIDATSSNTGNTSNPTNSITTVTNRALVVSFLGTGDATAATSAGHFSLMNSISNSGGGSGTTKSTTNLEIANSTTATARTVNHGFTWGNTNEWVMYSIAIKP